MIRVGYSGQSHVVLYTDRGGIEHTFGWQNEPRGGFLEAIKLYPIAIKGRVIICDSEGQPVNIALPSDTWIRKD